MAIKQAKPRHKGLADLALFVVQGYILAARDGEFFLRKRVGSGLCARNDFQFSKEIDRLRFCQMPLFMPTKTGKKKAPGLAPGASSIHSPFFPVEVAAELLSY
jgi:hypothetical protein